MRKRYLLVIASILVFAGIVFSQKKAPVNVYIIKKGDTLWDVSERFLNNPWLWPKLWEQNKYIENPDLIFPGEPLIIPGVPAPPVVAKEEAPALPSVPPVVEKPAREEISPEELVETLMAEAEEAVPVELITEESKKVLSAIPELIKRGIAKIYYSPAGTLPYFVEEKFKGVGKITGAPENREMFGELDLVYAEFNREVSPGEIYMAVRKAGWVRHPITGEKLGIKVLILGILKVERENEGKYEMRIKSSYDYIEKGDILVEPIEVIKSIEIRKAEDVIEGYVVGGMIDREFFGEGDVILLDLGKNVGVEPGNVFIIYTKRKKEEPKKLIGKVVVFKVWDKLSAGLITRAKFEIEKGYRIISDVF